MQTIKWLSYDSLCDRDINREKNTSADTNDIKEVTFIKTECAELVSLIDRVNNNLLVQCVLKVIHRTESHSLYSNLTHSSAMSFVHLVAL